MSRYWCFSIFVLATLRIVQHLHGRGSRIIWLTFWGWILPRFTSYSEVGPATFVWSHIWPKCIWLEGMQILSTALRYTWKHIHLTWPARVWKLFDIMSLKLQTLTDFGKNSYVFHLLIVEWRSLISLPNRSSLSRPYIMLWNIICHSQALQYKEWPIEFEEQQVESQVQCGWKIGRWKGLDFSCIEKPWFCTIDCVTGMQHGEQISCAETAYSAQTFLGEANTSSNSNTWQIYCFENSWDTCWSPRGWSRMDPSGTSTDRGAQTARRTL